MLCKIQFWKKLFAIGFPYKHCNFWPLCLPVKMASKTVIRPINCDVYNQCHCKLVDLFFFKKIVGPRFRGLSFCDTLIFTCFCKRVPSLAAVDATSGSVCVEECANSLVSHFAPCPSQKLSVSIPSVNCSSVVPDVLAPDSKSKSQMLSPLCSRSFLFFVASCSGWSMAAFRLLSTLSDLCTEAL